MTKDRIEEIHHITLKLLAETGVKVSNAEAKGLLEDTGCTISNDIAKFPESLIKESLAKVSSTISLYSRDGSSSLLIGQGEVLINPGSSAAYFKDRLSGEIRKGTSDDVLDLIQTDNPEWEAHLEPEVAETIKSKGLFGYGRPA